MDLYAVIDQVMPLLQKHGRLTYRAIKYQFHLDDEGLAALKDELIEAREVPSTTMARCLSGREAK